MIKTKHKYIDKIKVRADDVSLILGTIHPHRTNDFLIDFFYGNKNSIWNILSEAFPNFDLSSREKIIYFLELNNIWISDMVRECDRETEKVTQDKELTNIVLNTKQITESIKNSAIKTIYFTSGFSKNNSAKLFCDYFKIKPELNENREFIIPKEKFGKEIKGVVLFSPSGQANIGISRNKQYLKQKNQYSQYDNPISQFKIDFYTNAFKNILK